MKTKQKKSSLLLFDKIILGLNLVAAILLLLSYLAPGTDPRDSTAIATLGFGYLFLVAGNLVFVVYWLIRKPVFMLISTLCILAGFNFIKAQYGFRKPALVGTKADSTDLRVMQYNVHRLIGINRYEDMLIHKELIDIIDNKQPDIVNLEEFVKYNINRDSISKQIKDSLKLKYAFFSVDNVNKRDSTGNMIFSKYPIINSGTIASNNLLNTKAMFIDIKYKGQTVRVYCIHLVAVQIKSRSKKRFLSGKGGIDNSSFILSRLTGAFITRSYQVDQIKKNIQACPYPYVITGDFNDTPISYAVNEIGDGLKNAFVEKGSGFQTTYYASLPLQIDYIMASKQFDILNYEAIDKELSDHKPIFSDLRLK